MDKAGNFVGYLFVDGRNMSEILLEHGLATVHFTAERSPHYGSLKAAEERARKENLRVWTLPANQAKVVVDEDEEKELAAERLHQDGGAAPERQINYKNVLVTEVLPELRFYVQTVDQGKFLTGRNVFGQIFVGKLLHSVKK